MRKHLLWLLPIAALMLSGCEVIDESLNRVSIRGSGRVVSEKRNVSGFQEVALKGTGDLSIDQGGQESLTVEADDNILPKIETTVEGGRLSIGVERGVSIRPSGTIRYKLVLKELSKLILSGSGKISTGPLRCHDLAVQLPGSGEIRFDQLTADSLGVGIYGSGRLEIPGKVVSQNVKIAGSGDYEAKDLDSQTAEISISGSGNSTVWARDSLSAHISGSGNVDYYGNPRISKSVSGSGGIRNLGERP